MATDFSMIRRWRTPVWRRMAWRGLIAIGPITRATWHIVDRGTIRRHPYLDLPTSARLVRIREKRYSGQCFVLHDGTPIEDGVVYFDVHCDSTTACGIIERGGGTAFCEAFGEDLHEIAEQLSAGGRTGAVRICTRVRALVRPLHGTPRPVTHSLRTELEQLFQEMAVIVFRPQGAYNHLRSHYAPMMEVWLSLAALARERLTRHPHRQFSDVLGAVTASFGEPASERAETAESMAHRSGE